MTAESDHCTQACCLPSLLPKGKRGPFPGTKQQDMELTTLFYLVMMLTMYWNSVPVPHVSPWHSP